MFFCYLFEILVHCCFIADEERAMRRESYLKATEGGRMHFDSDLSDGDVSPQVLRRYVILQTFFLLFWDLTRTNQQRALLGCFLSHWCMSYLIRTFFFPKTHLVRIDGGDLHCFPGTFSNCASSLRIMPLLWGELDKLLYA